MLDTGLGVLGGCPGTLWSRVARAGTRTRSPRAAARHMATENVTAASQTLGIRMRSTEPIRSGARTLWSEALAERVRG